MMESRRGRFVKGKDRPLACAGALRAPRAIRNRAGKPF